MNNIEYVWVIQRDDGKFWNCAGSDRNYETYFVDNISQAYFFTEEYLKMQSIEELMEFRRLQNCKPLKVKIKVVEDE